MKKSLVMLAGVGLLCLGIPSVTLAQAPAGGAPFADVPADHWAYQSVTTLQNAGIVIGYPDGTYGGKRPMTRYEFATAIARLLPLIPKLDTSNQATKDDLAGLRSDLESKLAANSDAIEALRKLVDEFQPELQRLGQDVAAADKRLDALEARVAAVEEEQRRIKFTGNLNLIARADVTTRKNNGVYQPFIDRNGFETGVTGKNKLLAQTDVYNDFVLGIRGKISDTATANVKLDFGNYLSAVGDTATAGAGYGNETFGQLGLFGGDLVAGSLTAGNQTTTVWEAYLDSPVALGPLGGADLVIGRFGNQGTKYTLMQIDPDVYTSLYQTDSGNIITDGGKLSFKAGPVNVSGWAGKFSAIPFSQPYGGSTAVINVGGSNNGVSAGQRPTGLIRQDHAAPFEQGAGVRATLGAPEGAVIGVTLEEFGFNNGNFAVQKDPTNGKGYDKLTVLGGDFSGALPFLKSIGLTLDGAYNEALLGGLKTHTSNSFADQSGEAVFGAKLGGLSLKGGYQYVGPYYTAPGYWGKVGAWSNPTNVKGGIVSGKYALTHALTLNADGEFYKAAYGGTVSPLQKDDKLTRYQVGLGYGLTSNYAVDLGYENVTYDLKNRGGFLINSGKPVESYWTIGLGHTFNPNASFKLSYQIVHYDDKGTGFETNTDGTSVGKQDGGVAVGQFSLKF